jgi:hypothetical protein
MIRRMVAAWVPREWEVRTAVTASKEGADGERYACNSVHAVIACPGASEQRALNGAIAHSSALSWAEG